jgi:hypothetical protein
LGVYSCAKRIYCLGMTTSYNVFLALIPILVVIFGWSVIFHNSKKIATRNETFSIIKGLLDLLDSIGNDGCDLWVNSDDLEVKWARLRPKMQGVRSDISLLVETRNMNVDLARMKDLRRALTLNVEQARDAKNREFMQTSLINLSVVVNDFKIAVIREFEATNPPVF